MAKIIPMSMSGFCMWPGEDGRGHAFCTHSGCECDCHTTRRTKEEK